MTRSGSIGLPLLLKGLELPPEGAHQQEEDKARVAAAQAAIAAVERVHHSMAEGRPDADVYVAAGARVMDAYRSRIESHSQDGEALSAIRHLEAAERTMLVAAVQAERMTIFGMVRRRGLGSETARKLVRELDLAESRYRA